MTSKATDSLDLPCELRDIVVELREHTAVVRFNRPGKRNALRTVTLDSLCKALDALEHESEIRSVILTGAGECFCAGADMGELASFSLDEIKRTIWGGWRTLIRRIEEYPKPVIAAINGPAVGGGLEIASVCHLRIASESARLGLPEITHGHLPGAGGLVHLARLLPRGLAAYCMLTGDTFDARQALATGFVSHLVAAADLLPTAYRIAGQVASLSRLTVELTLRALLGGRDAPVDAALALERALADLLMHQGRTEMYEGFRAFANPSPPGSDD